MPESVKISELPALSSVAPNDIVPVVDADLTVTSKATVAQIAAIGGGPPGANTVIESSIQDGAVTAPKCKFSGPNLLFSRTAIGAGPGTEIACSPYARGLLAATDGPSARAHLDALQSTNNPLFTGQVRVGRGTATNPSIAPFDDLATGFYFAQPDSISIAAGGDEAWRFMQDGTMFCRSPDEPGVLRGRAGAVAWCNFNGTAAAGQEVKFSEAQSQIAARYGLSIPGAPSALLGVGNDTTSNARAAATRQRIKDIESARGYLVTLEDEGETTPGASWFDDRYGKINFSISPAANSWPAYCRGTERRANYFSPWDDTLWYWDTATSNWLRTSATNRGWIGSMTLTSTGTAPSLITEAFGIASVTRFTQTGGVIGYAVTFERAFPANSSPPVTPAVPDNRYCVVATANDPTGPGLIPRIGGLTNTGFNLFFSRTNGTTTTYVDPNVACFAVWR